MRKIIGFLFLAIIIISACEKDDFCTQTPVTPKLILRFYDADNRDTFKDVESLSVWVEGKDTITSYMSADIDSIAIPLNPNDSETIYHFKMNDTDGKTINNKEETFTINYTPENEFVSRSCGFRVIFNDANFSSDNTWINSFTAIETTIDNQNAAHVQVFH